MSEHVFVGFGFGPIQAGLFAKEAFQSGNFKRMVVAEIDPGLVEAVRANAGSYHVNVARADGIEKVRIDDVELLNPADPQDVPALREVLLRATEVATCLPSVRFYDSGTNDSVAALIAGGLHRHKAEATIVYAAENNNHAAEILREAVSQRSGTSLPDRAAFLNTVIGKMSRVVQDPTEIAELSLAPIAPGIDRAFLVEEFNRILVSKATIPAFRPGIEVFIEKDDLLPFEEAKLYGHNAIHALLGFIGSLKGYAKMTELQSDEALMRVAKEAFLTESGGALIDKYVSLGDALFTEAGYRHYAEDLLERMTNPYLGDTTDRAARDVVRKLGISDRIFGTMALALEHGIEPKNMATGALAGIALLLASSAEHSLPDELTTLHWRDMSADDLRRLLAWTWQGQTSTHMQALIDHTHRAQAPLADLLEG
ncbi:MAG: hypothetical protein JW741_21845 [Sedimentisphaerales bacterium]|nr:hypothetical protein [Sedimentisphaerales bacterium]